MGQIRVLPDHMASQIAAGEVVERPASALKELLENSLDAGADSLRVSLDAGGKKRIRVEDNGCGMDRDDCLMAVERHATSKLSRTEDLFSIKSLGFRGEALPSIASVSRFTLESRSAEAESGVRVEMHGSKLLKVAEVSRNPGTTVTVDNLFFNIPARKKFLRTTETELSWMVNLVSQYSVAHIDKRFFLEHNGRPLIDIAPVNTLQERVYQHYGKRMMDELAPVEAAKDWLTVRGLVSTPSYFKTSRQFQHLFVNGRLVRDRVLNHAISAAYEGFAEGRAFPVVFLFLTLPPQEVDVNVHPAKTEIKFIHRNFVHDAVRDAIRQTLVDRKLTIPYRFREGYHEHPSDGPDRRADPWRQSAERQQALPGADLVDQSPLLAKDGDDGSAAPPAPSAYDRFVARHGELQAREPSPPPWPAPPARDDAPAEPSAPLFPKDPAVSRPKVIGQFRDSYILAEQEGDLLLIDQHVAHERILYDQITESLDRGELERQKMIVPITVELTPQQATELEQLKPSLERFGFDLDAFDGSTYVIREMPNFAVGADLESLVAELVEKAQGLREDTAMEAMIDHFAATKACKAAVKINMRLTPEKMDHLIDRLWASSSPLFCPHGRPIIQRFRNDEIEKNFLRR